jgi:antitoxin (DNA-binding transcriptional repressor) of toxin-antitoxin stability system
MAQKGERKTIPNRRRPVAKLTPVPHANPSPNRQAWLASLAELRQRLSTGKTGLSVEQIIDEDRGN